MFFNIKRGVREVSLVVGVAWVGLVERRLVKWQPRSGETEKL